MEERERKLEELRSWALEYGSDLLKARIQEGFEWADIAGREYAAQFLAGFEIQSIREDAQIKERRRPSLGEIEALRSVRKALGDKGRAGLVRVVTWDRWGNPRSRVLIKAEVRTPIGEKILYVKII
jgi:hypothetical protein